MKFFQTINASAVGRFVDRKLEVLKNTDPDRIYIENIRSFYNMPFFLAKLFCEMAVKNSLFVKKFGVECPNEGRLLIIVDNIDDIPDIIYCENCELLEKPKHQWKKSEVKITEFYQLNRLEYAG